ncbi:hypothetical protein CPB83DRAFT_861703 [Crepidotus variabilis]|uniref:Uncharacterized protein n=1 Tax=Crepidotus variabilis TaxID=179855 RepID=A0A9P6E887_9AGAR|nr:hypothetical protein CPB83DRAFT_861703 [Crepidotus variabilis]
MVDSTYRRLPSGPSMTTPMPTNMYEDRDDTKVDDEVEDNETGIANTRTKIQSAFSRDRYSGALLFNFAAFILPALYSTLAKLWVANIDASLVSTTDAYTYLSTVTESLNEGLPRAAWSTIGNLQLPPNTRLQLTSTLIIFQSCAGFILSLCFLGLAPRLAKVFIPQAREISTKYVQLTAFTALSSTLENSVSLSTRALDKPDVPLIISSIKISLNIILDFMFISTFHIKGVQPSILKQATIRLVCELSGAIAGLIYFIVVSKRNHQALGPQTERFQLFSLRSLRKLARPGAWTFSESAIRNAIYLYLIHGIVTMGNDYATAWGVFNTIRWGIVMVPVQSLEATSNAFVGHRWGQFRALVGPSTPATKKGIFGVTKPALISVLISLIVEVPLCIFMSFWAVKPFAKYLSGSDVVATITSHMWRTIDWCYICYAVSTQLATILLATKPRWYLYQSLVSNLGYCLPWAIAITKIGITPDTAWKYHAYIFGGSLVVSLVITTVVVALWCQRVAAGRMK